MANNIFKELEKGNLSGVKRCVSLFPSAVNAKNSAGATPLHVAASCGLPSFVKELLVHGAQHDVADSHGNLPLHLAAEQGSLESVTELLTGPGRKLVVKTKNKDGQSPLHLAVRNGHTAVVAKLLEAGARTDAKDKAGVSPLELVSAEDEEMLQLLLAGTPTQGIANLSQGFGMSATPRAADSQVPQSRTQVPSTPGGATTNRMAARAQDAAAAGTPGIAGRAIAPTPATPSRNASAGALLGGSRQPAAAAAATPPAAPTPTPAPAQQGTPGPGSTSRAPRNSLGTVTSLHSSSSVPLAGGVPSSGVGATSTVGSQLQKHDSAIQSLQADLRAATERLGAVDACAAAQLECASQVERALELCGSQGRTLTDLETRMAFQEDRSRDTRGRLERLEEGERSLQDSICRWADEQRGLHSQVKRLADQVSANSGVMYQQATQAETTAALGRVQHQLQTDVVSLRSQVEQLAPALALSTTAGAEVRTLAARVEGIQQQVAQHLQAAVQQQMQAQAAPQSTVLLEQQVLQLQAQVQLLQLPVASLTQQCADLSSRLSGVSEWQQHARSELSRLVESNSRSGGSRDSGIELSDAVMRVLDTTARTMAELRQQQDETAKQVAALLQQQQAQNQPSVATSPNSPIAPAVPETPKSSSQRFSISDTAPLGGPPSRNALGRDAAVQQAEMRAELEALKSLVADVRKEVVSEGGSLRREWQRAFSDMQSRYGEQANELRAREHNIAKLREAAMLEEAERRAASGFEDKVASRLTKLETGFEYLTHRLEVLEEQVGNMAGMLPLGDHSSPGAPVSPVRNASTGRRSSTARDTVGGGGGLLEGKRSGPGPVSENHSCLTSPAERYHASTLMASALGGALPASSRDKPQHSAREKSWSGTTVSFSSSILAVEAAAAAVHLAASNGRTARNPLYSASQTPEGDRSRCTTAREDECGVGGLETGRQLYMQTGPRPLGLYGTDGQDAHSEQQRWWRAASSASGTKSSARPPRSPGPLRSSSLAGTPQLGENPEGFRSGGTPSTSRSYAGAGPTSAPGVAVGGWEGRKSGAARGAAPLQRMAPDAATAATSGSDSLGAPGSRAHADCDAPQQEQQQLPGHPETGEDGGGGATQRESVWSDGSVAACTQSPLSGGGGQGAEDTPGGTPRQEYGGVGMDPANVALGPQLLPAVAQAMLAPCVDIQRLANAAEAQQQQQHQLQGRDGTQNAAWGLVGQELWSQLLLQQQQQQQGPLGGAVVGAVGFGPLPVGAGGLPPRNGNGSSELSSGPVSPRREPPMCFFCPVQ